MCKLKYVSPLLEGIISVNLSNNEDTCIRQILHDQLKIGVVVWAYNFAFNKKMFWRNVLLSHSLLNDVVMVENRACIKDF